MLTSLHGQSDGESPHYYNAKVLWSFRKLYITLCYMLVFKTTASATCTHTSVPALENHRSLKSCISL